MIARLAQLMKERGFDEAHAIIIRPLARGGYQIISGHRRVQAAKRAGFACVPCWKREMTDGEAHMLLLSENIQDGLHPIEEGQHHRQWGAAGSLRGADRRQPQYAEAEDRRRQGLRHHQEDGCR